MTGPLTASVEFQPVECPSCGTVFAVLRSYFDQRVADQRLFWCPEACQLQLGKPGPLDALEERRVRLADEVEALQRRVDGYREEVVDQFLRTLARGGRTDGAAGDGSAQADGSGGVTA